VLVTAQTEQLFGLRSEGAPGAAIEKLVPQRFRPKHPKFRAGFFDGAQGPLPWVRARALRAPQRTAPEFPIEISLSPLETEDGTRWSPARYGDITDRKKARGEVQGTPRVGARRHGDRDKDGRILLVNAQTEKLFGHTRDELVGQWVEAPGSRAVPEEASRAPDRLLHRSQGALDGIRPGALRAPQDGPSSPIEISLSPLQTRKDSWSPSAIRDITERKKAEEKFRGRRSHRRREPCDRRPRTCPPPSPLRDVADRARDRSPSSV